ncbi:MAG: hypothetical protein ACXABY_09285 [Candidatus Thorarchaeota archaeon]|jgi:hypothetical protein
MPEAVEPEVLEEELPLDIAAQEQLMRETGVEYGQNPWRDTPGLRGDRGGKTRDRHSGWNPKVLTAVMQEIMDLHLFNPQLKKKEIAQLLRLSKNRVRRIMNSDMYRTRHRQRRLEIERLMHSSIARDKAKFLKLRNKMIDLHMELAEMDPQQYGTTKAVEVERLRQKSMSEILRVAEDNLKSSDNGDGEKPGVTSEHSVEGELDLSDPNAAYFRIVEQWRQSTK